MSLVKKSSGSSVSVRTIEFPENFSNFNITRSMCDVRTAGQKMTPIASVDLGNPIVLSVKKPAVKSSPIILTPPTVSGSKTTSKKTTLMSTSRNLNDTQHKASRKQKKAEFQPPCPDSVVLGAPKRFIGNCPVNDIAAGNIPSKKLITLTEDPRKRFCLRNPYMIHYKHISAKGEQRNVRELVKTAENLVTSSGSQSTISSICEVVDLLNPLNLDFQGMDYKNTYARDEQACQNQIEYRKVRRYKHRRNVKVETVIDTENMQQIERISVPKHFEVDNPPPIPPPEPPPPPPDRTFGKLIRAEQKPEVKKRIEKEEEDRRERYKQMYLDKKEKKAQRVEERKKNQRIIEENRAKELAEKDIQDLVGLLDRTILTKKRPLRQLPKRRDFPHTISETMKFRHQLKKSKRIIRDRAKVKQEFYTQTGKPKIIPEAQLEISTDSRSPSPRNEEMSTNDEDDMEVGQRGSKFFLRGFLYKLGPNLRGKFHQKDAAERERKVKGCITRNEWFETLVSKKRKGEGMIQKPAPGMELFPRQLGVKKIITGSPIKEFRKKPLGRHYDRVIRKNLRIKKPRQTKVKKFNLIGYLYGIGGKKKVAKSVSEVHEAIRPGQTLEYMLNRAKIERIKKRIQKRRRMHYLGIPCPQRQRKRAKSMCVDSESENSDYVPDDNDVPDLVDERLDLQARGNMPAPEYREPTLRRHPRHPRDYKNLRVPSEEFNEFVQKNHIPIMRKLKRDKNVVENVRTVKKTVFGKKFEARHHHDHWNPTQHKTVHIRYSRKLVDPKPVEAATKQAKTQLPKTFDKARPRAEGIEEIDFTLPKIDTDEMIQDYTSRTGAGDKSKARLKEPPLPQMKDMVFHSMEEGELQEFPGREKFLEFLTEIKTELEKRAGITAPEELAIDKNAYLNELKEDLKSIESCLSSLSSSECTNLSNDSGSFLMAGEQKIPLDYIRKSLVPFEEMNRSRFEAVPIDPAKEEADPFRTVPFAGQQKEQLAMTAAKDSFFTFNTRLQNGLRLRLEVKPEDPRKKLLGTRRGVKATAQVATDIDELYIEDLRNRPPFKPFKWNSCRTMIKDALRKKFESMLIQGEIVRTKIYDRRNENYFQQMMAMKTLFEKLFAKWEKKEYEAAMEVVHKVKPYYEATDKYRRESQELGKQYTMLNMEIVYIENDWMRRTILQNFHYLLAEMEWRVDNDWIHRNADGELEGFEESIAKRNTTNIRQRDKDDAWAIKEYYDNVYLQNYHPIIVVFQNAKEFINGIENLKAKTFVLLLELHYTLWILAELDQKYQEFSDWCVVELESKKTYAENKCANKYYMEDRASQLKAQVQVFLGKPIDQTFSDKRLSQMKGICNEVYKDVVPVASQMDISPMEQVAMISQVLTDLIGKFEGIDPEHRRKVEKKYRRILAYRRSLSKQAVLIEKRIGAEMIKVRRNLAPPFQKPKREGKLPRSELKKVVRVIPPKPVIISEKTKFFYKAFHEEGDLKGLKEARESLDVMDHIQESIVPFYFDHFLSINGYQPNYNFKTQIEMRDGPEIDRFQVKHVLPEVLDKFEKWQNLKKRTMDENINSNPHMYQNVQI